MRTWREAWEKKGMMLCVNLCRHVLVHLPLTISLWELLLVVSFKPARTSKLAWFPHHRLPWEWGCVGFATIYYLSRQTHNSTENITCSLYCAKQNRENSLRVCNEFNYHCSSLSKDNETHPWPSGKLSLTFFSVVLDIPTSTMVLYMLPIYTAIWELWEGVNRLFHIPTSDKVWEVLIPIST